MFGSYTSRPNGTDVGVGPGSGETRYRRPTAVSSLSTIGSALTGIATNDSSHTSKATHTTNEALCQEVFL